MSTFPVGPADLPGLVPNDQGWMHDVEVATIVGFATILAGPSWTPIDVLEVGCYRGRTSSGLLMVSDVNLTVVDNFKGPTDRPEEAGLRAAFQQNVGKPYAESERLSIIEEDSYAVMVRMAAHQDSFSLIVIDGDHRREGVARDLQAAWPLLLEGGYLFVDDLDWDSVRAGVADWCKAGGYATAFVPVTKKLGYVRKVGGRPVA